MTKNLASGIFLFTRVLGIGVRLYLGGAIMVVVWRDYSRAGGESEYLCVGDYFCDGDHDGLHGGRRDQGGGVDGSDPGGVDAGVGRFCYRAAVAAHPGWNRDDRKKSGRLGQDQVFQTGWDASLPFGAALKAMFEEPYTIFAAFIGSTLLTMATQGTDQDMVQRMLTAPDYKKSQMSLILSGLMDVPIAGMFLTVGILLYVYYIVNPDPAVEKLADNEIFGHYIVNEMPLGFRGLIIAGVFATMMGSTSAALNALATSFTKDFYQPYIRPGATDAQAIRAARIATGIFGVLMILVATIAAHAVLQDSKLTIIPIAVGILGYTYGALLGVFLLGMLTRTRGRDGTNVIAMVIGIASVLVLCRVSIPGVWDFGTIMPAWWPKISWPWFVFVGCVVTFTLSILFPTPKSQIQAAENHVCAAN